MTTAAGTDANGHLASGNHVASKTSLHSVEATLNVASEVPGSNGDVSFLSELQQERICFIPPRPHVFEGKIKAVQEHYSKKYCSTGEVESRFPCLWGRPALKLVPALTSEPRYDGRPLNIGIVLSGGQAPGGHNVIVGAFDFLRERCPNSRLYGFLNGCKGVVQCQYKELFANELDLYRNQGGFHLIGSGRDKIESQADLEATVATAKRLHLDGLVIVGGDDSNTNAAVIAEYFLANEVPTVCVGVPKTIDGDLKNSHIPISFGFDTATKVYSELIGNIMIDAASAKKYYHFVRLMGRSASHITLECALQTHPQVALISEEVALKKQTLAQIASQIADVVAARARTGKNYGVVLLPEGLIECVAELGPVIGEINELLARQPDLSYMDIGEHMTPTSKQVFSQLPAQMQLQLLLERDTHGNVQVARIETEKLLIKLVEVELSARKARGEYKGKFAGLAHYFGYEGRCSLPSNFDATYCYALGQGAAALVECNATGVMVGLTNLQAPAIDWHVNATPLVNMMVMERRKGKNKCVIKKALVEMQDPAFTAFRRVRDTWAVKDCFRAPGPIQFGDNVFANMANFTLALEINEGDPIMVM